MKNIIRQKNKLQRFGKILILILVFGLISFGVSAAGGQILFEEDFESGSLEGWTGSGLSIVDGKELGIENDTKVLKIDTSTHTLITLDDYAFTDFSYEVRIRTTSDGALPSLVFRVDNNRENYYMFRIYKNKAELYKATNGSLSEVNADLAESFELSKNVWYQFRVIVQGNTIMGYMDEQKVLEHIDTNNPLLEGGIGFRNNKTSYYDDIIIRGLGDESVDPGELTIENVVFEDGNGNKVEFLDEVTPGPDTDERIVKGLVTFNNTKQSDEKVSLIIALYDDNKLQDIQCNTEVIIPKQTSEYTDYVSIKIPNDITEPQIKLFKWNSMLLPLEKESVLQ